MASWLREGKDPPQAVLDLIVRYMNRVAHPVYVGIISLEVRWNLARTQEMMDVLVERELIRRMNEDERLERCIPDDANVYVLVGVPHPSKAHL